MIHLCVNSTLNKIIIKGKPNHAKWCDVRDQEDSEAEFIDKGKSIRPTIIATENVYFWCTDHQVWMEEAIFQLESNFSEIN